MIEQYDAIIIGSGQAAKPLSDALVRANFRVALIEKENVGGSCVNYGCSPTKTMVSSARMAHMVGRAAEYGVNATMVDVDMKTIRNNKQKIVEDFRNGIINKFKNLETLDLIMGKAKFISPDSVEINLNDGGRKEISSDKIFINAGCRTYIPDIPGIDDVQYLTSTSIMELDKVPEHLIVLGGGYIGIEFGQMFRRFGSRVTIVQRGSQLLAREDSDIAEEVLNILKDENINVILNAEATTINNNDGGISLTYRTDAESVTVSGSHLLVAVGRRSNADKLNLESAGIDTDDRGYIVVNEKLETNISGVFALGDIKGGAQFTHIAYDDFRIIRSNLLEGKDVSTKDRQVPYVVFMDPQLGRVGITETEARANGYNYKVAKIPMTYVARALETNESKGLMKAIVDLDTNLILGCAVLGMEGGEIMSIIQTAMMGEIPYTVLKDAVYAHPTLAESLNTLFMMMDWH